MHMIDLYLQAMNQTTVHLKLRDVIRLSGNARTVFMLLAAEVHKFSY